MEIITSILKYLEPCQIIVFGECNASTFKLATQTTLWIGVKSLDMTEVMFLLPDSFNISKYKDALEMAKHLVAIDLRWLPLQDLSFIGKVDSLLHLAVSDCKLLDISPVENLTKIEYLDISFNNVPGRHVVHCLQKLFKLQVIYAAGIYFTVDQTVVLLTNKPSLQSVSLNLEEDITVEDYKVLIQQFPGVKLHVHNLSYLSYCYN